MVKAFLPKKCHEKNYIKNSIKYLKNYHERTAMLFFVLDEQVSVFMLSDGKYTHLSLETIVDFGLLGNLIFDDRRIIRYDSGYIKRKAGTHDVYMPAISILTMNDLAQYSGCRL